LRKIASTARRLFWVLLLFIILSIVSFPFSSRWRPSSRVSSWESVQTDMRQQNFPRALAEAQTLVAREPGYYYGHAFLGAIYLAMGDLTNAETSYSMAYN